MGKRGRVAQPRELKIAKGTLRKCREVKAPPAVEYGIPTKPEGLSDAASAHWDRLIDRLRPWNILAETDGESLRLLVLTLERVDLLTEVVRRDGHSLEHTSATGDMKRYRNPDATCLDSAVSIARQLMAEFGLSPSSRGRLETNQSEAKNSNAEKFFV